MQHYGRVKRADSGQRSLCVVFFVCARLSVLHNEWSAARMFRTLAVSVLCSLLLQVDIAGGGVVGEGLQNWPVAPKVHQTWMQEEEREKEEAYVAKLSPRLLKPQFYSTSYKITISLIFT